MGAERIAAFEMSIDFTKVMAASTVSGQVAKFLVPCRVAAVEQVSSPIWRQLGEIGVWNTVSGTLKDAIQKAIENVVFFDSWIGGHFQYMDGILRKHGYGNWSAYAARFREEFGVDHHSASLVRWAFSSAFLATLLNGKLPYAGAKNTLNYLNDIFQGRYLANRAWEHALA